MTAGRGGFIMVALSGGIVRRDLEARVDRLRTVLEERREGST
jgi:hypothetical protein